MLRIISLFILLVANTLGETSFGGCVPLVQQVDPRKRKPNQHCQGYVQRLASSFKTTNTLLYDPLFVMKMMKLGESGGENACTEAVEKAACLVSSIKCNSFGEQVGACHSLRHLVTDECEIHKNDMASLDLMFLARIKDTQCIDERFKFNLNAPIKECREDDFIPKFGHCQHLSSGERARETKYELIPGRICKKPERLLGRTENNAVPCDCTLNDLRQIFVPIGLGKCQKIIYLRPDHDCSQKDFYPPYESITDCPSSLKIPTNLLFINDWTNAQTGSINSTAAKILKLSSSCSRPGCSRAEHGKSKNCSGLDCATWKTTRDAAFISPSVGSAAVSLLLLRLNISAGIASPSAVFRIHSQGRLAEGDRVAIRVNGVPEYQWTATAGKFSLNPIPLPAIPLRSGPSEIVVEFDRSRASPKNYDATIFIESLAIFPNQMGAKLAQSYFADSDIMNKDNLSDRKHGDSQANSHLSSHTVTLIAAFLIGSLPLIMLLLFFRQYIFMLLCSCGSSQKSAAEAAFDFSRD